MPYGWISSSLSNDGLIENLRVNVGLSDKVVSAMKRVDRANYCQVGEDAYYDSPQPMGHGQTISAPHGKINIFPLCVFATIIRNEISLNLNYIGSFDEFLLALRSTCTGP